MSNTSDPAKSDWQCARQQGVWRYILARGFLTAGLVFAFVTVIVESLVFGRELRLASLAVRTLLFGAFFGALTWSWNERRYKERIHRETQ